jgi:hypothetical protein
MKRSYPESGVKGLMRFRFMVMLGDGADILSGVTGLAGQRRQ